MERPRRRRTPLAGQGSYQPRVGSVLTGAERPRNAGQSPPPPASRLRSGRGRRARRLPDMRRRLLAGIVVATAVWWFVSPLKTITLPAESGTRDEVAAALSNYFQTHTRRNVFLDRAALESFLTQTSIHVTAVNARHNVVLSQLRIDVASDRPVLRWQTEGVQYTLSRSGIALYQTPAKGEEGLPLIIDKTSVPLQLKSRIVPTDFVTYIQDLETAALARKLSVRERMVGDSIRELEIKIARYPYRIRLSTQERAGEQMDALVRLETHFRQHSHPRSYVDLRVPNRAYWR